MEEHDYKAYPELRKGQMEEFGFNSPHPQIFEDFEAVVVRVIDGDTVQLECDFRDFGFPLRLVGIDAPELSTPEGAPAREYLALLLEGEMVQIRIDRDNRVDKYGRLLGRVYYLGVDVGDEMIMAGMAKPFERRFEGEIPDIGKIMKVAEGWLA